MIAFARACGLLDTALSGSFRRDLVANLAKTRELEKALARMRESMRAHEWKTGAVSIDLAPSVLHHDRRTRQEGVHVLHDWDGKADRYNDDIVPVDVLNYVIAQRGREPSNTTVLAIILDYYFLYLLALMSLRLWDEGDPDANLDRLGELLDRLQGPDGSGQRFASNAETLILIATAHYEPNERGFAALLERVRMLGEPHRLNVALGHAASMGCHLRFGFEATYGRDTIVTRNDNTADYPWLCFALATLMDVYARMQDGALPIARDEAIVEALLNGLSADARAFIGEPPSSLAACEAERSNFAALFHRHRQQLLAWFERYRPSADGYSPLNFFFNFSHNIVKGTVVDALLRAEPWRVGLNDLLTSADSEDAPWQSKRDLATTLMNYARSHPDTIRGRLTPVIVYDPQAGRRAFSVAIGKLAK